MPAIKPSTAQQTEPKRACAMGLKALYSPTSIFIPTFLRGPFHKPVLAKLVSVALVTLFSSSTWVSVVSVACVSVCSVVGFHLR